MYVNGVESVASPIAALHLVERDSRKAQAREGKSKGNGAPDSAPAAAVFADEFVFCTGAHAALATFLRGALCGGRHCR
jgi:hypothetical protein